MPLLRRAWSILGIWTLIKYLSEGSRIFINAINLIASNSLLLNSKQLYKTLIGRKYLKQMLLLLHHTCRDLISISVHKYSYQLMVLKYNAFSVPSLFETWNHSYIMQKPNGFKYDYSQDKKNKNETENFTFAINSDICYRQESNAIKFPITGRLNV